MFVSGDDSSKEMRKEMSESALGQALMTTAVSANFTRVKKQLDERNPVVNPNRKVYDLSSMSSAPQSGQLEPNKLYVEYKNNTLYYAVRDPNGNEMGGVIEGSDLEKLKAKNPAFGPKLENLEPSLEDILKITLERGHTRETEVRWNSEFDNFFTKKIGCVSPVAKDIILLGVAKDIECSKENENRKQELQEALDAIGYGDRVEQIHRQLSEEGVITHIEMKNDQVVYHSEDHITGFQPLAKALTEQLNPLDKSEKANETESSQAKAGVAYHDCVYDHDDGVNEFKSADIYYQRWNKKYDELWGEISKNNSLDMQAKNRALDAIKAYQQMTIPYEAYKTVVLGTLMMKSVDGQPTAFLAGKAAEECLDEKDKAQIINDTSVNRVTMAISLGDSHAPALRETLAGVKELKSHMPSQMLESANISTDTQKLLTGAGDAKHVDNEFLAYSNNMQMFSELHEKFSGPLTKAKFDFEGKEVLGKDVWKMARDAARIGDDELLEQLLSLTSKNESAPDLPAGLTIFDIYLKRTKSDSDFAKKQGPELYEWLAEKIGCDMPKIDAMAYKKHAEQLDALSKRELTQDQKMAMGKANFYFASHGFGSFVPPDLSDLSLLKNRIKELKSKSTIEMKTIRSVQLDHFIGKNLKARNMNAEQLGKVKSFLFVQQKQEDKWFAANNIQEAERGDLKSTKDMLLNIESVKTLVGELSAIEKNLAKIANLEKAQSQYVALAEQYKLSQAKQARRVEPIANAPSMEALEQSASLFSGAPRHHAIFTPTPGKHQTLSPITKTPTRPTSAPHARHVHAFRAKLKARFHPTAPTPQNDAEVGATSTADAKPVVERVTRKR